MNADALSMTGLLQVAGEAGCTRCWTSAPAAYAGVMADLIPPETIAHVAELAGAARQASRRLALLSRADKDAALRAMADALDSASGQIIAANDKDIARGRAQGLAEGLLDRLRLDQARVSAVAEALRDIAGLPDPVGEVVRGSTLANGLQIRQVRVPMGVVGMIYEARPNVTVDAAGLALKSGNAVVLRGGAAAGASNRALVAVLRTALEAQGLPADAVSLLDEGGRDAVRALMTARGLVDVLIPRGGADLIQTVVRESTVPVIETGVDVDVAVADAGLDHGHGRLAHDGLDQIGTAPRDEHVDQAACRHQRADRVAPALVQQRDRVSRQTLGLQRCAQHSHQRAVARACCGASAQHDRVAALERQTGRIDRHVRTSLVDHRDNTHGHPHLSDLQAVGQRRPSYDLSDRVRQRGDIPQCLRDCTDPGPVQP